MTPHTPVPHRARLAGAAGVVLAVVALHALVLQAWPEQAPPAVRAAASAGPAVRVVQMRLATVAPPRAPSSARVAEGQARAPASDGMTARPAPKAAAATTPATAAPVASPSPAAMQPAPVAAPAAATVPEALPLTAPTAAADSAAASPDAAAATPAEALAGVTVPTYATRLPPAFVLTYQVQRPGPGVRGGPVELAWQPAGDRYMLSLGQPGLGSTSTGTLDALGVAPERQADLRRAREVRAVNFRRDAGRITYSGPQVEHPLLPGAQDRLSWLVQLAGVLSADAALAVPGRSIQLYVTGPRGDAAVWTLQVIGPDSVELPGGARVQALRLLREPEGPRDMRVELWVDPARHHLPVRLRLQPRPAAEATEFLLAVAPGGS